MNADQDMEGETTMKAYITPMMTSEVFAPNEYIAVCWQVACSNNTTYYNHHSNAPSIDRWSGVEGPYDDVFSHNGDCRNASNNYFRGNSDGSNLEFLMETSSDQGELTGGFDDWIDVNGNGIVDGNGGKGSDVIYWYTRNGTRRRNHWGYVQSASSDHINRS